jgi:hypothetical protein
MTPDQLLADAASILHRHTTFSLTEGYDTSRGEGGYMHCSTCHAYIDNPRSVRGCSNAECLTNISRHWLRRYETYQNRQMEAIGV